MLDYRFPTALQMVLSVAMAEQMGERCQKASFSESKAFQHDQERGILS